MELSTTNNALEFYRIKTEWVKENDNGSLSKTKTEELAAVTSYTEAEQLAYDIAEMWSRSQFGKFNIEIVKTKINNIIFNDVLKQEANEINGLVCNYFEESEDSGVGLYNVKAVIFQLDERTGQEKRINESYFVPAKSNTEATQRIKSYLQQQMSDFVIRDTKFDKAEAIFCPKSMHEANMNSAK